MVSIVCIHAALAKFESIADVQLALHRQGAQLGHPLEVLCNFIEPSFVGSKLCQQEGLVRGDAVMRDVM